ncbi:TorF family putative porin [Thioalkalivibrio sp. ALJ24]|uniref:TorF family putative porin n=1 Tax=Thioalkalivibrio sp. ALJ24 TaxID=545276 RepID=UPI00037AF5B1|nr:TorF family putative porin [Thioalkalivibrio sp. ALJ24]
MKKFAYSAVASAVLAVGSTGGVVFTSTAAAEFSANISIVSDYELRGGSETDGGAAIQGGFDWEHASGFYLGTWASNVDFGSETVREEGEVFTVTDDTTYELDLYLGFADSFDNGLGYDVGYVYYAYPDASVTVTDEDGESTSSSLSADFGEIYGSMSFDLDVIAFYGGLNYVVTDSSDSALETDDIYFYGGLDVPFAEVYSAGFMVGRQTYDGDTDDYTHYSASLARDAGEFGEFSLNLAYKDEDDEDLRTWVGWSKSF